MKTFRSYQMALELARAARKIKLPAPYHDQFQRAVLSIPLNLAEGSAKESRKDRARFYQIAMGSLRETQALIEILELEELRKSSDELGGLIHCLIRSLRR